MRSPSISRNSAIYRYGRQGTAWGSSTKPPGTTIALILDRPVFSEALSYAMSLPVATTISGIDFMEVRDQNLAILRDFKPLSADQMLALRDQGEQFNDGRYELYKSTLKYDSDLGRSQHGYPSSAELPL
jgi:hypothetical protein